MAETVTIDPSPVEFDVPTAYRVDYTCGCWAVEGRIYIESKLYVPTFIPAEHRPEGIDERACRAIGVCEEHRG